MKVDKKKQELQRQIIEKKISRFSKLNETIPSSGWVRAIRGSLGMTVKQLSMRLGTSASSVTQLEEREPKKNVTLNSLEKAANAMGCDLIYAIVPKSPNKTLEDIIAQKAQESAARILKKVAHTMKLEAQSTSNEDMKKQIERTAKELQLKADSRIWDLDILPLVKKGRK